MLAELKVRKHVRGVSMIEILIGIAIIAILIALGLPSIGELMRNTKVRNAAESVQNGLNAARAEAVKRNATIVFQLTDSANVNWQICLWDMAADACKSGVDLIQSYKSSDGASNVRAGADAAVPAAGAVATRLGAGVGLPGRVGFTGFGRLAVPATDLQRIDFYDSTVAEADQRRMVLLISTGGQVRMCDPQVKLSVTPRGCEG